MSIDVIVLLLVTYLYPLDEVLTTNSDLIIDLRSTSTAVVSLVVN